jgi:hypothetical protein
VSDDELTRRLQTAVWGLATTLALFACSLVPWITDNDETYALWQFGLPDMPSQGTARWASLGFMITIVLGVNASANATRRLARITALAASATAFADVLLLVQLSDDSSASAAYGCALALILTIAATVLFSLAASRAPWKPGRKEPRGRPAVWMDKSFGTWRR